MIRRRRASVTVVEMIGYMRREGERADVPDEDNAVVLSSADSLEEWLKVFVDQPVIAGGRA